MLSAGCSSKQVPGGMDGWWWVGGGFAGRKVGIHYCHQPCLSCCSRHLKVTEDERNATGSGPLQSASAVNGPVMGG